MWRHFLNKFIIVLKINAQVNILINKIKENIRFTISGNQCIFPSKYKDTVYNTCIVNESNLFLMIFNSLDNKNN